MSFRHVVRKHVVDRDNSNSQVPVNSDEKSVPYLKGLQVTEKLV